jgi:hypothetical protein
MIRTIKQVAIYVYDTLGPGHEEACNFYRAVMKLHHPDYVEMIEEFKY